MSGRPCSSICRKIGKQLDFVGRLAGIYLILILAMIKRNEGNGWGRYFFETMSILFRFSEIDLLLTLKIFGVLFERVPDSFNQSEISGLDRSSSSLMYGVCLFCKRLCEALDALQVSSYSPGLLKIFRLFFLFMFRT